MIMDKRVVTVKATEGQKARLRKAAGKYGQDVAPWLLQLGLREAAGTWGELGSALQKVKTPKKVESGNKTGYFSVRMTDEQKALIEKRATHVGVPLSVWLLMLGLLEAEKG